MSTRFTSPPSCTNRSHASPQFSCRFTTSPTSIRHLNIRPCLRERTGGAPTSATPPREPPARRQPWGATASRSALLLPAASQERRSRLKGEPVSALCRRFPLRASSHLGVPGSTPPGTGPHLSMAGRAHPSWAPARHRPDGSQSHPRRPGKSVNSSSGGTPPNRTSVSLCIWIRIS